MDLINACKSGDDAKVFKIIRENKIDVNKCRHEDERVPTAIWCCCEYKHMKAMEILMCSSQTIDTSIKHDPSAIDPRMAPWELVENNPPMLGLLRFYESNPNEVRKLMRLKHQFVVKSE